jgi:hypothetical protein
LQKGCGEVFEKRLIISPWRRGEKSGHRDIGSSVSKIPSGARNPYSTKDFLDHPEQHRGNSDPSPATNASSGFQILESERIARETYRTSFIKTFISNFRRPLFHGTGNAAETQS